MEDISKIINKYDRERGSVISILEDIQAKYGYLPQEALKKISEQTGRSLVDIYGVATFYKFFSLNPRGKHLISVCLGTACHVRGAPAIAKEFENQLGVHAGETTSDKEFTLETVYCLGACALGPIVVVDGHYFSNVRKAKVKQILDKALAGVKEESKADDRCFPIEVSCGVCGHSLMTTEHFIDTYPSIELTVSDGQKKGWFRLSSLYGAYASKSEYEISQNTALSFSCPHCHAELKGGSKCIDCESPMFAMVVKGGGVLQICSRYGCKGHTLDIND